MPSAALGLKAPETFREENLSVDARIDHAVANFAQGVQLVADLHQNADETVEETRHVGELTAGLIKELQRQGRNRPHPLMYVNLSLVAPLIFACGVLYQRVNTIEEKMRSVPAADSISQQLVDIRTDSMQMRNELGRLQERLDRILDRPK